MYEEFKSILKHSLIYGLGNILSRAVGFILIPLYTNYLSPSEYGVLEIIDLASYILAMFLGLGIAQSTIRFYYEYDQQKDRKAVISSALFLSWGISFIAALVLSFFSDQISLLFFKNTQYARYLQIMLFTLFFTLGAEVPLALLRTLEKSTLFTIISVIRLIMSLSLNILFIVGFKWGILGILISSLISNGVVSLFLFFYTCRRMGLGISWLKLKEMLKYGLPYVPGGVSMFIINFADRFFLQRLSTLADVGVYSLGYKFGMIINFLILSPFLQAWGPKRFQIAKTNGAKEIFSVVLTYFWLVEVFCALGIALLIKDVLRIMSPPEYLGAYKVVPLILLSYVLQGGYFCIQIGILLQKKTKYIALITAICAVSNLILNYLLIPKFGMMGAAWATLATFAIMFTLNYFISNGIYYVRYELVRILKVFVLAIAFYIASQEILIERVSLSLLLNLGLGFSFPFALYLLGFYRKEEIERLKQIKIEVVKSLHSLWSKKH